MTSPSKAKGNTWERECAKILTKTFGYHFERNKNGSGAFVGGKNSVRKKTLSQTQILSFTGDIIPPLEMKNIAIECKFYKDFPFHHFLINKSIPELDDWIQQHLEAIDEHNFWFIVFKINQRGSFIVIPKSLCEVFIDDRIGNHSTYFYNDEQYIVTEFEPFIKLYKDQIFEKCH